MSSYRRNYREGGTYFFTINLLQRDKTLLVDHIEALRSAVATVKTSQPFTIDAWVVLPDHLHCIWTLPEGDSNYSSRWREVKKSFVKQLAKTEKLSPVRLKNGERGIWQRRFWEHTIRSEVDYQHHIDYVYINPLKHGLVSRVKDWPFSSFHRDVKLGLYAEDWCGDLSESNIGYGEA